MVEDIPGRIISGALFGVGAGLVMRVVGGSKREGENAQQDDAGPVRPVAKTVMKGITMVSDRIRSVMSDAREGIDYLYAEAQSETHGSQDAQRREQEHDQSGNIPVQS